MSKAVGDPFLEFWSDDNHVLRWSISSINTVYAGVWRQRWDQAVWDGSLYRSDQQPDLFLYSVLIPPSSLFSQYLTEYSNGDGIGVNNGLNGKPASGKIPITTLGSTIVNLGVDPVTGILTDKITASRSTTQSSTVETRTSHLLALVYWTRRLSLEAASSVSVFRVARLA